MEQQELHTLIDHLFRHESGKLVSVLTRIFGSDRLELAEDMVQETLADALEIWKYKGVPENPAGWLHTVSKNKALNILKREKLGHRYADHQSGTIAMDEIDSGSVDRFFSDQEIADDMLRMIFTCCHPSITQDSQVALALKTLCGFSMTEIAHSFLTEEETIKKRLSRARTTIRDERILYDVPTGKELEPRLSSVLEVLFLLFNEGYSASSGDTLIRFDLCSEAIRLAEAVVHHPALRQSPEVSALLALMYFNASRFSSRQDDTGRIIPMSEQDRSMWDAFMITKGFTYLDASMRDGRLSRYHILATISACHCSAPTFQETDWKRIVSLYDTLLQFDSSPIVILNRAVAISQSGRTAEAITELELLQAHPAFVSYHLFHSTLGEFYLQTGMYSNAMLQFQKAIKLTQISAEKEHLSRRIAECKKMEN